MTKPLVLGLAFLTLLAAPAMAAPICSGTYALDPQRHTEAEINDFNYEMLRGHGVDVTRAEMWGGCIRAFVRTADGREEMQFYDPLSLRRVE